MMGCPVVLINDDDVTILLMCQHCKFLNIRPIIVNLNGEKEIKSLKYFKENKKEPN